MVSLIIAALALTSFTTATTHTYHGCINAPSTAFPIAIAHAPASGLSISQCQSACSSLGRFAALGARQCRCSSGPSTSIPGGFGASAGECTVLCVEDDEEGGVCGGLVGSNVWSVYSLEDADEVLGQELKRREGSDEDEDCSATTTTSAPSSSVTTRRCACDCAFVKLGSSDDFERSC